MAGVSDPHLADALGCSRFCRDLIGRNWKGWDFTASVYWAARWSAHWAQLSKAYATKCGGVLIEPWPIKAQSTRTDAFQSVMTNPEAAMQRGWILTKLIKR